MRIGIDARILAQPRSGIGVYTINLIKEFLSRRDLQLTLFSDRPIHCEYRDIAGGLDTVYFGQNKRKYWAQVYLPQELKKHKIDVYHATWNNAVPVFTRTPSVLTLHDIIPMVVPGYFSKLRKRIKYNLQCRICSRRAAKIITVSEYERNVLIKKLRLNPDKIYVTYNGIEDYFKMPVDESLRMECLKKYNVRGYYIINGGGINQPKRNILKLVEAFSLFLNKHPEVKLLLIGDAASGNPCVIKTKELIGRLGIKDQVLFLGQVDRQDALLLLKGAGMMVFPSVYESFGIPVLEAMAAGVPVITSNTSALSETAGGAARLVRPDFAGDISSAMDEVYSDSALRESLIGAGRKRIEMFSWKKTAEKTIEVYREVVSNN